MSLVSELTKRDLINIKNDAKSYEDFFTQAFNILLEKGYVKETFYNGILEREKKYPTGLEMPKIVIAIPHTDAEHVNEPFIFINKMASNNLEFIQMGTDDYIVNPEFIIILGINDKKNQVGLLAAMMELFDDENFIREIKNTNSVDELYEIFKKY